MALLLVQWQRHLSAEQSQDYIGSMDSTDYRIFTEVKIYYSTMSIMSIIVLHFSSFSSFFCVSSASPATEVRPVLELLRFFNLERRLRPLNLDAPWAVVIPRDATRILETQNITAGEAATLQQETCKLCCKLCCS